MARIFFSLLLFCTVETLSRAGEFSELFLSERAELNEILRGNCPELTTGGGFANTFRANTNWIEPTPSQPMGPFYPIQFPSEIDTNLRIVNDGEPAIGTAVIIQGQIMDRLGNVIRGAKVEIWQACASGKYNHDADPNTAAIDPNFQYYATTNSDDNGHYIFETIVPGPYPASSTWWRPPHIHYKITAPGYAERITQLYFDGNSFTQPITSIEGNSIGAQEINRYNNDDLILQRLSPERRAKLIVSFRELAGSSTKIGLFNIYLAKN